MVSAILLAAGSSKRMGNVNKLLLSWLGSTVIAETASRLLEAPTEEVIVVTGHQAPEIEAALHSLPVRFAYNPSHATGMTSSIQTGIAVAHGNGYMICLADMVLITPPEYTLLSTAFEHQYLLDDRCIILPDFQGLTGNPVIFSAAWRSAILQHSENEGCRSLVRENKDHHLRVGMPTDHILKDIDRPGDYQALAR